MDKRQKHSSHGLLVITELLTKPEGMAGNRKARDSPKERFFAQNSIFVKLIRKK